ncbi:hypothetical protein [Sphingobacterium paucimobilis]|uniref:Uncharacterized protein n=1 Tax=Sphingobacterium paucimobilis HER1398 TaxID=1346330 RepID=U2H6L3_9SPHI|nr:hypothetical protein [Sphingobacterium paucimobilis]ERJ57346.1 hypothetical protein M472_01065 [Sphingobacterium paucimobilis HER1398]
MAIWENKFTTEIKLDPVFAALKSLISDGTITEMISLREYSPTKLMAVLKMNHQTFIEKCEEPWKFSTEHILLLSYIIDIDPILLFEIIQKESLNHLKKQAGVYLDKIQKKK